MNSFLPQRSQRTQRMKEQGVNKNSIASVISVPSVANFFRR